jgi:hypothetical protein
MYDGKRRLASGEPIPSITPQECRKRYLSSSRNAGSYRTGTTGMAQMKSLPEKTMQTEEHKVSGKDLLNRVKELVHQGNIRRITIKNGAGKNVLVIPLTIGVVGAVLLPVWAAVGAIAALASDYTLVVEKDNV